MSTSANGAEPHNEQSLPPTMDRAEELVDMASQRLEQFVSFAGKRLQKWLALAREEGEDIWAEAQHIRQGNQQTHQTTPQKTDAEARHG